MKQSLLIFSFLVLTKGVVAQTSHPVFNISSFDIDRGFYDATDYRQENVLERSAFLMRTEQVGTTFFKGDITRTLHGSVLNAAVNLVPYSKKLAQYSANQSLRLTVGYVGRSQIIVNSTLSQQFYRKDTLLVKTTSSQTGHIRTDSVFQDSVITSRSSARINSNVMSIGASYLFTATAGSFSLSAGPGVDLNIGLNSRLSGYTVNSTYVRNGAPFYQNMSLEDLRTTAKTEIEIKPVVSLMPNIAFIAAKAAKKRNNWFDHTSLFLKGMVGGQLTFLKAYELSPILVLSGTAGIRYSL